MLMHSEMGHVGLVWRQLARPRSLKFSKAERRGSHMMGGLNCRRRSGKLPRPSAERAAAWRPRRRMRGRRTATRKS